MNALAIIGFIIVTIVIVLCVIEIKEEGNIVLSKVLIGRELSCSDEPVKLKEE